MQFLWQAGCLCRMHAVLVLQCECMGEQVVERKLENWAAEAVAEILCHLGYQDLFPAQMIERH